MDYGIKLDPGEKVLKVVRRHIFDVVPGVLTSAILAFVAAGLGYVLGRFPNSSPFPPELTMLLILLISILAAAIFLITLHIYRHNLLIFTNIHIVQVEQLALFQRSVAQLSLLRIEDVSGIRRGIFQSIFDYGELQIQSAGEKSKFVFKNAPHPQHLADEALERHEVCVREAKQHSHSEPHEEHA